MSFQAYIYLHILVALCDLRYKYIKIIDSHYVLTLFYLSRRNHNGRVNLKMSVNYSCLSYDFSTIPAYRDYSAYLIYVHTLIVSIEYRYDHFGHFSFVKTLVVLL